MRKEHYSLHKMQRIAECSLSIITSIISTVEANLTKCHSLITDYHTFQWLSML